MTRAQRQSLRHYGVSGLLGVAAAAVFTYLHQGTAWDYLAGALTAVFIVLGVYVVERKLAQRLQRLPFLANIGGHLAGFLATIVGSFYVAILIARLFEHGSHPFDPAIHALTWEAMRAPPLAQAYGWAFLILAVLVAHRELSRKLGPGVLRNWMLGRYHRPRQEDRVFMFLDLKGSTTLAEQLGDLRFSEFVREFFADITPALVETRAEVSHYIGDEVVISWRLEAGLEQANCLRCFFLAQDCIEQAAARYQEAFGTVPQFKAGAHAGPVVATDVGTVKSEIVFHGDVVNTAARIQAACAEAGTDFLASDDLISRIRLPDGLAVRDVGEFHLKGKGVPLRLHSVSSIGS